MTKTKQIIVTGQIRLRLDPLDHDGQPLNGRELAEAARQFLREQLGLARVHLQAPRAGRGEERGGVTVTPHFVYGTFDFPYEPARAKKATSAATATSSTKRLRKSAATTGKTKKLAATGKTRKLKGTP